MRSAIVTMPAHRTGNQHRQVLRAAVRQLERADDYVAAVAYMEIPDAETHRSVRAIRASLDDLRRHLADLRARLID